MTTVHLLLRLKEKPAFRLSADPVGQIEHTLLCAARYQPWARIAASLGLKGTVRTQRPR
jgi:hypothetical protein